MQRRADILLNVGTGIVFLFSVIIYLICIDRGASLWDCPEYILGAYGLEIGHPPGNPTWQLLASVIVRLSPDTETVALTVNIISAVAMAAASMLLYRIAFIFLRYSFFRGNGRNDLLFTFFSALSGSLCFAWCDSVIFSAVEAEVYALSIFFSALMIWLMLKWALSYMRGEKMKAGRWLMLLGYISGLGIGVHELNLLMLTPLALIYVFVKYPIHAALKGWLGIFTSFVIIGLVLTGLMPGLITLAGFTELFCVNSLGLSYHAGIIIFIVAILLILMLLIFVAGGGKRNIETVTWCRSVIFFIIGTLTYFILPVRASANPPVNEGNPADPFSLQSYFKREQYGSRPLIYGPTPYSFPLRVEGKDSLGGLDYSELYVREGKSAYVKTAPGKYKKTGGKKEYVMSPELNMFFPRMQAKGPEDLKAYASWAGMTPKTMDTVFASVAVDSTGNAVGKLNTLTGEREKKITLKPGYINQLRYLAAYQIGYMYFRYLMWNFSGRQNNYPSTGEIEHGNFITGIDAVDNMMLGDQNKLPKELREENRGFNRYFMLPFIIGVLGAVAFIFYGKRSRRVSAIVAALFVMTGIAIVFYLNQGPGEARERDYSFLGSYFAFSLWISFGVAVISKIVRNRIIAGIFALFFPGLILSQTYDDHYRGSRKTSEHIAFNILESLEPDAILFAEGDNVVFPLWYAQEVLGLRKDVRVVAVPYLSTTWYPPELQTAGEISSPLRISGSEEDFASDRLAFVRYKLNSSDTLDAKEAIMGLYKEAKRGKEVPIIPVRYLKINKGTEKAAVIDLKELASPNGKIFRRRLLMADILASNPDRPVYWHSGVETSEMSGLEKYVSPVIFGYLFTGPASSKEKEKLNASSYITVGKLKPGYTDKETYYADPYVAQAFGAQRLDCLLLAERLLKEGRKEMARTVCLKALELWSFEDIPALRINTEGKLKDEALMAKDILIATSSPSDRKETERMAKRLNEYSKRRENEYRLYYHSLPHQRRNAISSSSSLLMESLPD